MGKKKKREKVKVKSKKVKDKRQKSEKAIGDGLVGVMGDRWRHMEKYFYL